MSSLTKNKKNWTLKLMSIGEKVKIPSDQLYLTSEKFILKLYCSCFFTFCLLFVIIIAIIFIVMIIIVNINSCVGRSTAPSLLNDV